MTRFVVDCGVVLHLAGEGIEVAAEHERAMPIRLLGDAVLRRRAWELAEQLGWAEPGRGARRPAQEELG